MGFSSILVLVIPPPYLSLYILLALLPVKSPSPVIPFPLHIACVLLSTIQSSQSPSSPTVPFYSSGYYRLYTHIQSFGAGSTDGRKHVAFVFLVCISSLCILLSGSIHSSNEAQPLVTLLVLSCPEL